MKNIRIEMKSKNNIVVIADTERFGKNKVVFEGNTFNQCFDYVKKETGRESLRLEGAIADGCVTDREGRTFPAFMKVLK